MAGSSLLTLIDDIASTLDDVAVLTKIAAKKTGGVLGDDLALNAQQVAGVSADREIPVVLAVAKGSAINKIILVPAALLISQLVGWLITPLLLVGGSFLCFEGFEKVHEKLFHKKTDDKVKDDAIADVQNVDIEALEKEKIKGAIRTDFILSAEIVVITLGTVAQENLTKQATVLTGIAALMTMGVYGLVAGIVKLDDLGLYLSKPHQSSIKKSIGGGLLSFAPNLMKFLGLAGTIAMFLVGGGIVTHSIPYLHHMAEQMNQAMVLGFDLVVGLAVGAVIFFIIEIYKKTSRPKAARGQQ